MREAAEDSYENERSLVQDLTFEEAARAFGDAGVPFEAHHMRTLGLIDEDGLFTNLALLLSDQCPATVKAAVFQGAVKATFLDRFEFEGSLFRQFEEVLRFVDRYNATRSEIGPDMRRIDTRDYPEVAVREALLNMFVHREYEVPGPALVSVFDDRSRQAPRFDVSDNALKVTLPSMRDDRHAPEELVEAAGPFFSTTTSVPDRSVSRIEYAVVQLAKERGEITRKEVEEELGTSQSAAVRLLSRLQKRGLIFRVGKGKNTVYVA